MKAEYKTTAVIFLSALLIATLVVRYRKNIHFDDYDWLTS